MRVEKQLRWASATKRYPSVGGPRLPGALARVGYRLLVRQEVRGLESACGVLAASRMGDLTFAASVAVPISAPFLNGRIKGKNRMKPS